MLGKKFVMNTDAKFNIKFHKLDIEAPLTIIQLANFGVSRIPVSFNVNEKNEIVINKTLPCIANVVIGEKISNEEIIDIFQPTEDEEQARHYAAFMNTKVQKLYIDDDLVIVI